MLRDFGEKGVIRYVCSNCGRTVLTEYISHIQCPDSVPGEQLDAYIKQKVSLFRENFNVRHDYTGIAEPVMCPYCGKIQPWSSIPPKQHKKFTKIAPPVLMIAVMLMANLVMLILPSENIGGRIVGLLSFTPLYALFFAALFKESYERRKALKRLKSEHFIFPVYYDEANIDELRNIETVDDELQEIPKRIICRVNMIKHGLNSGAFSVTLERHDTLRYTCSYCKHAQQFDYVLKKRKTVVPENKVNYHDFLTYWEMRLNDKLYRKSKKLEYNINTKHYLGSIDKNIICPNCTRVQPWSKLSATWKKVKKWLWIIWIVMFFSAPLIVCLNDFEVFSNEICLIIGKIYLWVNLPLPFAILAADLAVKLKLKKMSKAMGTAHPTYDNLTNSLMPVYPDKITDAKDIPT